MYIIRKVDILQWIFTWNTRKKFLISCSCDACILESKERSFYFYAFCFRDGASIGLFSSILDGWRKVKISERDVASCGVSDSLVYISSKDRKNPTYQFSTLLYLKDTFDCISFLKLFLYLWTLTSPAPAKSR